LPANFGPPGSILRGVLCGLLETRAADD